MPTEVGGDFYWVLRGACKAAAELRQPDVGADTVLISTMNNFPAFRRVLGGNPAGRVGHGPDNHVDGSGPDLDPESELEMLGILREVHWRVFGWASGGPSSEVPQWADEVRAAVRLAMAIAVARGAPWVGADHLLEALLTDSANSASEFVRRQRVDLELLTEVAHRTWPVAGGEPPRRALADLLDRVGVLIDPGRQGRQRSTALSRRLATGVIRGLTQTTPALAFLEEEATAQTVRLGHDRTTPAHLVMAVLVLEDEMAASGLRPANEYLPACDFVFRSFLLDRESVSVAVASMPQEGPIASPQRRRNWRSSPKNPPWTVAAARAAEGARSIAHRGNKVPAGSAHLLYAVLSDPDGSGRRLLRELSVDPVPIRDLLASRLRISNGLSDSA